MYCGCGERTSPLFRSISMPKGSRKKVLVYVGEVSEGLTKKRKERREAETDREMLLAGEPR